MTTLNIRTIENMTEEQKKAYEFAVRCFEKNLFTIAEIYDFLRKMGIVE